MNITTLSNDAGQQLQEFNNDALIKSIGIPARPVTLVSLQNEIAQEEPDFGRVASLVGSDVTLTIAVLRIVNSPAFGLSRRCETVENAINMLGLKQLNGIVTGLMLRNVLRGDAVQLTRFWDVSSKRSYALSRLARGLGGVYVDVAQSFGLFCDVGIPLLMQRFPDYMQTLNVCNSESIRPFTEVEQSMHHTDHAMIGALMARSWGVSPTLCLAIKHHHDYGVFNDPKMPEEVTRLIAMGLIAELAIQRFVGLNRSTEWSKGGAQAASTLALRDQDIEDWVERLDEDFARGVA